MSSNQAQELENYPKYKRLYLMAFEKLLQVLNDESKITSWKTPDDVMRWWIKAETDMEDTEITRMFNELMEE